MCHLAPGFGFDLCFAPHPDGAGRLLPGASRDPSRSHAISMMSHLCHHSRHHKITAPTITYRLLCIKNRNCPETTTTESLANSPASLAGATLDVRGRERKGSPFPLHLAGVQDSELLVERPRWRLRGGPGSGGGGIGSPRKKSRGGVATGRKAAEAGRPSLRPRDGGGSTGCFYARAAPSRSTQDEAIIHTVNGRSSTAEQSPENGFRLSCTRTSLAEGTTGQRNGALSSSDCIYHSQDPRTATQTICRNTVNLSAGGYSATQTFRRRLICPLEYCNHASARTGVRACVVRLH